MDNIIVVMEKNIETGILEKEYCLIEANEYGELLDGIYVINKNGALYVHLKITTGRDVSDWEYSAIFDYYDPDALSGGGLEIQEILDEYNPSWEIIFPCPDEALAFQKSVVSILEKHFIELQDTYKIISDKKADYE
ncbi:MAG: hypothetical protein LBV08_09245 [Clostridiales bacterium]|jgi:hypothetical protein|nr:hypothetical protein [Clostridiales bacterium]